MRNIIVNEIDQLFTETNGFTTFNWGEYDKFNDRKITEIKDYHLFNDIDLFKFYKTVFTAHIAVKTAEAVADQIMSNYSK